MIKLQYMRNFVARCVIIFRDQFKVIDIFRITPEDIKNRTNARIQKNEVFAVGFSLFILVWFLLHFNKFVTYYDLQNFLKAGKGDLSHYYYAYWMLPIFSLLSKLPYPYPFLIIGVANIICAFFAIRIFGGKVMPLFVSIYMIYILSQGQITGIILGGFALLVVGLVNRKWHLAGLGMLIATIKYQMGVVPALSLLVLWPNSWQEKLKVFLAPVIITVISIVIYPNWPIQLIQNIQSAPPYDEGSISLWRWFGPFALILWLPPLCCRITENERFFLLLSANALSLPYFQQTDLILLFSLLSGYGAAFANIPFLIAGFITLSVSPWIFIRLLFLIPLGIYFHGVTRFTIISLSDQATPNRNQSSPEK